MHRLGLMVGLSLRYARQPAEHALNAILSTRAVDGTVLNRQFQGLDLWHVCFSFAFSRSTVYLSLEVKVKREGLTRPTR